MAKIKPKTTKKKLLFVISDALLSEASSALKMLFRLGSDCKEVDEKREAEGYPEAYSLEPLRAKCILELVSAVYSLQYEVLMNISSLIKKDGLTMDELADIGFFLRETENALDEARKDAKAHKELLSKVMGLRIARQSLTDPSTDTVVHGRYASASADTKIRPKMPKKGSPEYEAALDYFFVPRRAVAEGVLKIDWKGASDYLTAKAENGEKLPVGLQETYTEVTCTFVRKNKTAHNV